MKNYKIALVYSSILIAVVNIIAVFLTWLNFKVTAELNLVIFNPSYSDILKSVNGINLPGGIIGLFLAIVFVVLVFLRIRIAALFGLAAVVNGTGYALGWFVDKTDLLSIDIIEKYATAQIIPVPQTGLILYLTSAILMTILAIFVKK